MATYPIRKAGGITSYSPTDAQFFLWAGDAHPVTNRAKFAASVVADVPQFTPCYMVGGELVPWAPGAVGGGVPATGTLTFSGTGTAADTVTIGATVITLVAADPTGNQVLIGGTAAATAANMRTFVNANSAALGVTASGSGAAVVLTAINAGTAGNAIATTESGTGTAFGAATLTGGTAGDEEAKVIAVTGDVWHVADAATSRFMPYYDRGCFNHEALVWPAGVTSLADRQQAMSGTPLSCAYLP